jgi:hypothetical protein
MTGDPPNNSEWCVCKHGWAWHAGAGESRTGCKFHNCQCVLFVRKNISIMDAMRIAQGPALDEIAGAASMKPASIRRPYDGRLRPSYYKRDRCVCGQEKAKSSDVCAWCYRASVKKAGA